MITRPTLADRVADAIVAYILEEGLEEGDELPSTGELALRYGVSRTVAREAIADLAGRGVILKNQGKASVLGLPGEQQLGGILQFRAAYDRLSPEQVLEARRAIELMTVRIAAERRSDADVAELEEALHDMGHGKFLGIDDADVRFHRVVARAANPLLLLMLEGLEAVVREMRIRATAGWKSRGETLDSIIEAHRRIVDAVRAGSPDDAEAAMREHFAQTELGLQHQREMGDAGGGGPARRPRKRSSVREDALAARSAALSPRNGSRPA